MKRGKKENLEGKKERKRRSRVQDGGPTIFRDKTRTRLKGGKEGEEISLDSPSELAARIDADPPNSRDATQFV